jgi:glycosyltransferase involved in cell wall biosynthesis
MQENTIKSTLTIVICTFNRAEILERCLNSLQTQNIPNDLFQVIIVDNNSTDNTKLIIKKFTRKNENFKYLFEPNQGLSIARNRGLQGSLSEWVGYIDDDAIINSNFIENVIWTFETQNFDVFGGCVYSWFHYGKPEWFPVKFEQNWNKNTKLGLITANEEIWGGVMFFKTHTLNSINGFPEDIGMSGNKISYGEESLVINKLIKKGYNVGFNPDIIIYHLVGKHKLLISWHLLSAFAKGRDGYLANFIENEQKPKLYTSLYLLIRLFLTSTIRATYWFFSKKHFSLYHVIYHIGIPTSTYSGTIYGILKNKFKILLPD